MIKLNSTLNSTLSVASTKPSGRGILVTSQDDYQRISDLIKLWIFSAVAQAATAHTQAL